MKNNYSSVNYILLVHKSPRQFQRLVRALDAPWVNFFIHVDKKTPIDEFKKLVPEKDNLHYIEDKNRISCVWGSDLTMCASMACMRMALEKGTEGHFVLLSGQDYPLRTPTYIRNYFESHKDYNFMTVYPIPDPAKVSENGGYERLISYAFDCQNPKDGRMKAKIQPKSLRLKTILGFLRLLRYRRDLLPLAIKLYFKKRAYPKSLAMHFNEFWCTFNKEAVQKLINVYDKNSEIREYYKYTHIPEETAFSSILLANPEFEKTLMPMCHYIDWTSTKNSFPKTIDESDIPKIKIEMNNKPYIMFARKFEENATVLDLIDDLLLDCKREE